MSALYVSPTGKQTGVFSRKKIDEAFEVSPLLKANFYPGIRGFRIEEKRLKNYSTMYFRSAYFDADSIRGITAKLVLKDEIQDMLIEVIPVIDACAQKQRDSQFVSSGTPKTFDNPIHTIYESSSGCEWHVKCRRCGHHNKLGIDLVHLDRPGLWCTKCDYELNTLKGYWVQARESEVAGFKLPYIILPKCDVDWKELHFKMRNYDTGALMNEVFGESYDNGSKPISRDELISVCHPTRQQWIDIPEDCKSFEFYAGIDWGGGNTGFSILTIGYFDTRVNKFLIVFSKRYLGKEAASENLIPSMCKTLLHFKVRYVGADLGFGFGLNDRMRTLLPSNIIYVTYRHAYIKHFVAYDEDAATYVTNRTEVMTDAFNALKAEKIEPFVWSEFEDIGKDYLNISSEYSDKLRQMRYIHTQPDDSFHSLVYMRVTWLVRTGQKPSTRYRRGEDDADEQIWQND
jgi:hypothetical protein